MKTFPGTPATSSLPVLPMAQILPVVIGVIACIVTKRRIVCHGRVSAALGQQHTKPNKQEENNQRNCQQSNFHAAKTFYHEQC